MLTEGVRVAGAAEFVDIDYEELQLQQLEADVNRGVLGVEEVLGTLGATIRTKKPHEADLFSNVLILRSHIESLTELASRVESALAVFHGPKLAEGEERKQRRCCPCCSVSCTVGAAEWGSDTAGFVCTIVNNVMKTQDLSATSAVGWVAVGFYVTSEVFAKIGDIGNSKLLKQEATKTRLEFLRARLAIVGKTQTMMRLFKLFELIKSQRTRADARVLLKGVQWCEAIPSDMRRYVDPEVMMCQLFAVSRVPLERLNTRSKLGAAVVRVIERNRLQALSDRTSAAGSTVVHVGDHAGTDSAV